MKTNLGYTVYAQHPMAPYGYRYRMTVISGWTHVEEYVAPMGVWVHMGIIAVNGCGR